MPDADLEAHINHFSMHFLTALAKPVLPSGYWVANQQPDEQHPDGKDHKKALNLTYDDGPCPATTPRLLELLAQEGIKATFFFIGENIEKYPQLVARAHAEGHTIGNHSQTHPFMPALSRARMATEIDKPNRLIEQITGQQPTLFRPPYGIIDGRGATLLKERRMSAVYWGAVTQDFRNIGADAVVKHIMRRLPVAPLIVMHEGESIADQCLQATARIITLVKAQGYFFTAIK